jgi:hypothetical protein
MRFASVRSRLEQRSPERRAGNRRFNAMSDFMGVHLFKPAAVERSPPTAAGPSRGLPHPVFGDLTVDDLHCVDGLELTLVPVPAIPRKFPRCVP